MRRLAVILLVDGAGRLLLQERDSAAPIAPDKWGLVGGHVEDDEDFETAAYRELEEETGFALPPGSLRLWCEEEFGYDGHTGRYRVYVARVDLTDADVVVGEGRQIVFVPPQEVARLDRSASCRHFADAFLGSGDYRALIDAPAVKRRPRVLAVPGPGAEDVLVDEHGQVWTGTEDGSVFRISPDGARIDRVGNTGGRPLGLELLDEERLVVCDARLGLLAMHRVTGAVETLVREVDGVPMVFCNNAAVARNGDIWFSDSSTVFAINEWKSDFAQHTRTGRLLCRRADGALEVHLSGLAFANGVALAADESYVAVAESGARTVCRLWLTGERVGERDFLVPELPGYPDNIARGSDGLIWVSIASPYDAVVERLHRAPLLLRKLVTKLPERLQPKPKRTVRAQAYDDTGRLVHDVQLDATDYHMATGVREHDGAVWFGSLVEPAVAVLDRLGR